MLNSLLAIFVGGGMGSLLRWGISLKINPLSQTIPFGTLLVNLLGCFTIGLALALIIRTPHFDPAWRLFIVTGFCGGLTTFSTFSIEVVYLLQDERWIAAGANIMLNLVGSLAMTWLAFSLVSWVYGR